ncbi:unnamed protein product [Orchesella dallaii]|uniref:Uncharacterized protein n=1 Tax=Orchesella dallaii TaxID=48710 RepID=A0ABP1RI96_9HEXA
MNFMDVITLRLIFFVWICTFLYIVTTSIFKRIQENKHNTESWGQAMGLNALPGPRKYPIIGNAFQLPVPKYIMKTLFDWCRKYGPCFRITVFGIECVVISKPSMAQELEWIFEAEKGRCQTISKLLGRYALQSIVDSVVSIPDCYNDTDVDNFLSNFKRYTEITSYRILHPWLAVRFIWRFHPLSTQLNSAIAGLNKFAQTIIHMHIRKTNDKKNEVEQVENRSIISQMLNVNSSFKEIQTEVTTMLFAVRHKRGTLRALNKAFPTKK